MTNPMIPVSDGPREVRCSSPVIILGGDPPAAGPLHRDGRDHAVVILLHVSLAARDGVHYSLLRGEFDGPRAPLGSLGRRHTTRRDDTEVIAEVTAWERGRGFNQEKSKQYGPPMHVLSGSHFFGYVKFC